MLQKMKMETLHIPLQERIADQYRRLIQDGALREGERLPTVRQVAKELSISITPAISAFQILEKEGLIHTRQGAGTFVGRVPLRLPKSLDIGVLFREPTFEKDFDTFGLEMFLGVQNELQSAGHRTFLATMRDHGADAPQMAAQFEDHAAHGYILDEYVPEELVKRFVEKGRPVVVVNRPCDVEGVGTVQQDAVMAARLTVEKILGAGHRSVGSVYNYPTTHDEAVHAAFAEAMAALGPADGSHVSEGLNIQDPDSDWSGHFKRIMDHHPRPTVLFCSNDATAYRFSKWAALVNLRVPDDVSIVGNLDLAVARRMRPPLTTVRFDPREMGAEAVREVVRCCRKGGRKPGAILIPGEWVERESLIRQR
jgi:LacI family transcriptional regulator